MTQPHEAQLEADADYVVVRAENLRADRDARLFFGSVLGGEPVEGGWRCPRRKGPVDMLAVRINAFLEGHGWKVARAGRADAAVQKALEQKRSFQRTRDRATELRSGAAAVELSQAHAALAAYGWNGQTRTLKSHQEQGLVHGLTAINAANFSVPGSGKTATTLAVAVSHLNAGTIDVVLVVGPLSCFEPWETEVRTALVRGLWVKRVRGSREARRESYEGVGTHQLLLLSYATAAADRSALIELGKRLRVMLVVDESHRIKRFKGGVWAPALMAIAREARVRVILSGTPMPQSGRDLYSQLNVLWPDGQLTGPRDSFAAEVERDFDSVLARVSPFLSRTPKSALGLTPYVVIRHDAELVGTQREVYELVWDHFRHKIEGQENWQDKIDSLKRGRPIRLLQAVTNPGLLNKQDNFFNLPSIDPEAPTLMERLATYAEMPVKSLVALEIARTITGRGEKLVCWSNFVTNLDHLKALFQQQLGVPCFQIDGRVPVGDEARDDGGANPQPAMGQDTREIIIANFLDSEGPSILVTNPASCSESISLHRSCRNAVYVDRTYDCALFLQSIDRIHRLGLPEGARVEVHIVMATIDGKPTVDHLVEQSLARKEALMRQLLEGAEVRPLGQSDDPLVNAGGDAQDLNELLRFLLGESS